MRHFCCLLHSKWCMPGQILTMDQECTHLQVIDYVSELTRWFHQKFPFLESACTIEEYKWESKWNIKFAPSARRANFPVSFWVWDTLKQRLFGCQVEFNKFSTSLRYLHGIETVSLLVLMTRPSMVCFGPITNSDQLSIAREHFLIPIAGSPITTNMALVNAARTISMCALSMANMRALPTYIHAGRSKRIPIFAGISTCVCGVRVRLVPFYHVKIFFMLDN